MSDLAERLRASTNYDDRSDAADLIEAQAARIAELEAEVKMWRDENFKKQTAYQQRGVRIAELEAALRFYADAENWRRNGQLDPDSGNFTGGPASAALAGGKDE